MAHNLHIGQNFEDFAAFENAIMRYQNADNVQFYRRDSVVPLNSSALTSMRFNSLLCHIFLGVPHFFNFVFSLFLNKD